VSEQQTPHELFRALNRARNESATWQDRCEKASYLTRYLEEHIEDVSTKAELARIIDILDGRTGA